MATSRINPDQAKTLSVDASGFGTNLAPTDTDVQKVADALNVMELGSGQAYPEDNIIIVQHGATDIENGGLFLNAYSDAKNLIIAGATEVWIIVPAGTYDIESNTLSRTEENIHIVGEGYCRNHGDDYNGPFTYPITKITGSATNLIVDSMRSAVLKGVLLHQETSGNHHLQINEANGADGAQYIDIGLTQDGTAGYGIYTSGDSKKIASYFEHVHSAGPKIGNMEGDVGCEFSGKCVDCSTPASESFGGRGDDIVVSGTFIRCYSGSYSFGNATNGSATFSGYAEDCKGGDSCFGSCDYDPATFSGKAVRCTAGLYSFAGAEDNYDCIFSGEAIDCVAGESSFGGDGHVTAAGILIRCKADGSSFGSNYGFQGYASHCEDTGAFSFGSNSSTISTGTLEDCKCRTNTNPIKLWNGRMIRCDFKNSGAAGEDCVELGGSLAVFEGCILEGTSTGKSIDAASAQDAEITECTIPQGLGANVTNIATNPFNSGIESGASFTESFTCTAAESVGDSVYISAANTVSTCDPEDATKMPSIGVITSKTGDTTAHVQMVGLATWVGIATLTPGSSYYIDTDGTIVVDNPPTPTTYVIAQLVGVAVSTTHLRLDGSLNHYRIDA